MSQGLPKPFDPAPFVRKIKRLQEDEGLDLSELLACCPPVGHILDAIDFKPYIIATARSIARDLEISTYE